MPQIYKVCVISSNDNANEVFAIKPYLESFDSFKDEIYIRMPELKNQPFRIYYEDEEGDKITIFNALDFGIFQEQKFKKVFVVKNGAPKNVQFQENPNVAFDAARTSSAAASASHARVLHPNVICDSCDKSIFGYRYKCLECADFDLCMDCEPKSHNHHLMIRICDPNDAAICYRSKLGKRFLRHRRSESLCMKPEEKEKEKEKRHHHGHKRHASTASGVRPPTVSDVLCSVLKSFAAGANNGEASKTTQSGGTDAATNTANASGGNVGQSQKASSSSSTNATQTPINPPAYGFNFPNANPNEKCVPLKQGIDMLSHVAQNFAAMMDPFATFMDGMDAPTAPPQTTDMPTTAASNTGNTPVNATVSQAPIVPVIASTIQSAAETAAQAAAVAAKTAAEAAKSALEAASLANNANSSVAEPLSNTMFVTIEDDVSDDDDDKDDTMGEKIEDLRKSLQSSMTMMRDSVHDLPPQPNKKDERSGSIDTDKGSPSREWTFIDKNDIAETIGAVGGAIPKKPTPPPTAAPADETNNKQVDYAELSRLLSTHIVAQNQATPLVSIQSDGKAQSNAADNATKSAKTPPSTPIIHPDARVNESLHAMMAMGFSNEGGWLTQLLETVDGSISNALDLLQPQK